MTDQELEFKKKMQDLIAEYGVTINRGRIYYPGDPIEIWFNVRHGISMITLEDIAEKSGGISIV